MPILHSTFKASDAPAGAINVTDQWKAYLPDGAEGCWMWKTHEGLCLATTSRPHFMDSYYTQHSMLVWNPVTNAPETIDTWCDRDSNPGATPASIADATPEVQAAYESYLAIQEMKRRDEYVAKQARTVARDKEVKVVRGRKVPIGTQGRVFWMGDNGWGMSVGLKTAQGVTHFTSIRNVEVVLGADGKPVYA